MAKCGHCKEPTTNRFGLTYACSVEHVIAIAKARKAKKDRKELLEDKKRLKTRQQWLKEAQNAFNAYIRERDRLLPCISCQRHHNGQYHAGHFRTTKAAPELRFCPDNVHKQCSPCNNYLSGNLSEYRRNLIGIVGLKRVEWLEGPHEPKKYTVEELQAIKTQYTKMRRELEKERL